MYPSIFKPTLTNEPIPEEPQVMNSVYAFLNRRRTIRDNTRAFRNVCPHVDNDGVFGILEGRRTREYHVTHNPRFLKFLAYNDETKTHGYFRYEYGVLDLLTLTSIVLSTVILEYDPDIPWSYYEELLLNFDEQPLSDIKIPDPPTCSKCCTTITSGSRKGLPCGRKVAHGTKYCSMYHL